MIMKKKSLAGGITLAVLSAAFAVAQQGAAHNPRIGRHPNLGAAQQLASQAVNKITQAQRENEFDMGGHAQRAKGLLEQANRELIAAAGEANEHNNGHR